MANEDNIRKLLAAQLALPLRAGTIRQLMEAMSDSALQGGDTGDIDFDQAEKTVKAYTNLLKIAVDADVKLEVADMQKREETGNEAYEQFVKIAGMEIITKQGNG